MSLNWSIAKVRDHQELTEDEQERRITEGCCWASLVYGIGRITTDNIDKWILRQELVYDRELGADRRLAGGHQPKPGPIPPMRLTRAQYERRIGFETNVTTCFQKRWLQLRLEKLVEDAKTSVRRAGL